MRTIKILIPLLICLTIKGQNALASFEFTEQNVAYIGIVNPIKMFSMNKIDSITIEGGNGILEIIEDKKDSGFIYGNLTYRTVTSKGNESVIQLWNNGRVTIEKRIRVRRIPDPVANFVGIKNGSDINLLKLKYILENNRILSAEKPDGFDLDIEYKVSKWNLTVLNSNKAFTASGIGGVLSDEAVNCINKAENGSRIYTECHAISPDGTIRLMSGEYKVWGN